MAALHPKLVVILVTAICILVLAPVYAANKVLQGIPYVRIFADASGDSHFEDGMFPVDVVTLQSGEEASVHSMAVAGDASMLMLQPGVFEDWHPSPASQMMVIIQGEAEVGASDGEMRYLTPGTVFVMDDTTGRGHTTRTVGDVPHIGMMIPKGVSK